MARYKKPSPNDYNIPGLFDDLEPSKLFPDADPLPIHPVVERAARRSNREARRKDEDFFTGDDLTPLELSPTIDHLDFISFGSGSSGNCAYIGNGEMGFLIDAGVDADTVISELQRHGIKMESIKGIILTHDHSDHVRFVYTLVRKRFHMGVYCTPRVLNGMLRRHNISNRIKDYHRAIYKEHPFRIGPFTITAFEVMHDGTDNAGFIISYGGRNMVVATDLGCVSERADFYIRQADFLMIEANYDDAMLTAGSYPEYLKARIRSDHGHLGNHVTAEYLSRVYSPRLKDIFLCHLSKDNNTPQLALQAVEQALTQAGATVGDFSNTPYARLASVQLMALPRFEATPLIPLHLK